MRHLPEDLTLAEFPEYLAENSIDFAADSLKNFIDALRFDVRAEAKKIIVAVFKSERELEVVCRRAKGETLEGIGREFGLNSERVRQIESKSVAGFMKRRTQAKKIFSSFMR